MVIVHNDKMTIYWNEMNSHMFTIQLLPLRICNMYRVAEMGLCITDSALALET